MGTEDGFTPKFSSDIGYLVLLDNLIRLASQYLIGEDWREYYLTLEAWYIETIHRFRRLPQKDFDNIAKIYKVNNKEEVLKRLDQLRASSINGGEVVLKNYHELLNTLTHAANLRLRDERNLPGVING